MGHTGLRHLGTGFPWFPCVYKRMLRWFPRLQVATACFSCSPPDLNFLVIYFIPMYMHNDHCHRVTAQLQLIILLLFQIRVLGRRDSLSWLAGSGRQRRGHLSYVQSQWSTRNNVLPVFVVITKRSL